MSRKELNLGILAHVDAGKTTLTERLLYNAGVITKLGSVDAGTTHTDTLALERQRGITIRSTVASFAIGDVHVNLIDTPGHPDFIAEVERVLSVLDGAVLVVSGVEGVQPQTRILMRALERLEVPTLFFVNKLDRTGADAGRVIGEIRERLGRDDPTFQGSARTGEGVEELAAGIVQLLPGASGDPSALASAKVFKIERGPRNEKIVYARLFGGTIRTRDRIGGAKVTALAVFEQGGAVTRPSASAGEVAKLWGLEGARVGDWLGEGHSSRDHHFAPPTLESVVAPLNPGDGPKLRLALTQLEEQDPLIGVRRSDGVISVSLYGEVQKEVVGATLADEFGIAVEFRETTPIYVERPVRSGRAFVAIHEDGNPFDATLGFRIEPGPPESGLVYRAETGADVVPLHIYKTHAGFEEHMREYVEATLLSGLYGWQVTDCIVTLTEVAHAVADGSPSKRGASTAGDFKGLTPLVIREAVKRAGTVVCEPMLRTRTEIPVALIGPLTATIARLGGTVDDTSLDGDVAVLEGELPAARLHELQRQLPDLTGGEGVLDSSFAGYRAVSGVPPRRAL
ncbi:MAG TPA: translation factor GTPase family protein [Gaiellaceae bacterium]|nr:translation factor GTPase family protein [Gaiellaceae bacterium]